MAGAKGQRQSRPDLLEEKVVHMEERYGSPAGDILRHLYWKRKWTRDQICRKMGFSKQELSHLLRQHKLLLFQRFSWLPSNDDL